MSRVVAAALACLLLSGCGIHYGNDDAWEVSTKPVQATSFKQEKAYFRAFEAWTRSRRISGGGVSGQAIGLTSTVSPQILDAARAGLPFAVSTAAHMGKRPKYMLTGGLTFAWRMPWWTWLQLLDLWIHAWFVPTLGRHLDMVFTLTLSDAEGRLIRKWTGRRAAKYVGDVWWMIFHGGSGGFGHEEGYTEFLRDAFAHVGEDLRRLEAR